MRRIVIKIGSNILSNVKEGLDARRVSRIAADVSDLREMGYEVVIVSSGAVAAGMRKLGLKRKPDAIKLKQAAAAIGQSSLMWAYEKSFSDFGKKVAQVLLTNDDLSDRKRYINSKNTLLTLLSYGIIPVVNENDTVATDEIKFGDNDTLASLVALLVEAEKLIILSDVEGLYREDPRVNSDAALVPCLEEITPEVEAMAGGAGSTVGTGGMYSKLVAAKRAASHGIEVFIISGRRKGMLTSLLKGQGHGTCIKPAKSRLSHRKGWIAYNSRPRGSVVLDDGAVKAITERGGSLLPSGIVSVDGEFDLGDPVYCLTTGGKRVAKGLANYSSADLRRIMRKKTTEIERILGYKYSDEAIHRDNLALL